MCYKVHRMRSATMARHGWVAALKRPSAGLMMRCNQKGRSTRKLMPRIVLQPRIRWGTRVACIWAVSSTCRRQAVAGAANTHFWLDRYDWVWLVMIVRYEAARRLQDAAIVDSDLTRRMGRAFTKVLLFASGCKVCVVLVVPRYLGRQVCMIEARR